MRHADIVHAAQGIPHAGGRCLPAWCGTLASMA
jgi:hypothetical protein